MEPQAKLNKLHIINSLTKELELFEPRVEGKIDWYMCGPTVYAESHIGHAKSYIQFDTIRRIFRDYFKYDTNLVMGCTDIDDKIIRKAIDQNVPFTDISRKFEKSFLQDMEDLNVENPTILTRVSEYVPEIVAFIEKIIDNGFALSLIHI